MLNNEGFDSSDDDLYHDFVFFIYYPLWDKLGFDFVV